MQVSHERAIVRALVAEDQVLIDGGDLDRSGRWRVAEVTV